MTRRRRLALAIESWLYKLAFWLDVHTAPKYDPTAAKWSGWEMTDTDPWENYFGPPENEECE